MVDKSVRADFRYIRKLLDISFSGKVEHIPREFELVSKTFTKLGGSWENLFKGSTEEIELLKKVIKIAVKNKYITRSYQWEK